MKKKNEYQKQEDDVKVLIAEAKVRNDFTDEQLAKKIGMSYSTFKKQKLSPGSMRMSYVWLIAVLAGKKFETIEAKEAV